MIGREEVDGEQASLRETWGRTWGRGEIMEADEIAH